jgi:DNA/RNA-binding domain of Phe-tRNA-synthetase-like protein
MTNTPTISIDDDLADVLRLGWFTLEGVETGGVSLAFDTELERFTTELRASYATPAEAADRNRPARVLYRAVGLDPTRYRPSSEALQRRVLQGKPLYRVNRVVDGANLCSLEAALPVGLYDLDQVAGDVRAALGAPGDGYDGINKGWINLEGRLALFDHQGPFGNPSADSFRTRIRESTRRALFLYFAPFEFSEDELAQWTRRACTRLGEWTKGEAAGQGILPVRG